MGPAGAKCSKCELRHNLFSVDNTRQVRGVLLGHTKRGVGNVVEEISSSSRSQYSKTGGR